MAIRGGAANHNATDSAKEREPLTYRDAGVDIDRATAALDGIKRHAHSTFSTADVAEPVGHFGGVYRLPAGGERLLVASADGVGTKLKLAFVLGGEAHRRVGADLVGHCVNDLLACGARPLFFLDYVAMGRLDGETLERLVGGMAAACRVDGVALIGGETAEMPGLYAEGEYDVAGFIVGEAAPDRLVDGSAVEAGDLLVGLPAVGLHTNGYSLARRALGLSGDRDDDRRRLERALPDGGGVTIGEALMRPHPSYFAAVYPLVERGQVRGMAHITGGGLLDNVPRMLPEGLAASFERSAWPIDPLYRWLVEQGAVGPRERYRAFNMGLGFVLAIEPRQQNEIAAVLPHGLVVGRVVEHERGAPRVQGLIDDGDNDA